MSIINMTILLGTLTGILLVVGFLIGGFWGMTFALILSIVINFVSYWYSDGIVLKMYKATPLDDPKIKEIVEDLAREAKIPTPRLYMINSDIPNAFATGRTPRRSAIAITHGLLQLNKDELEGVLAHEISHITNRDVLVGTLAATIAGAIAYLAQIGYWNMFFGGSGDRDEGGFLGLILIIIFAPLAALLIRMAISRSREYKADYTGALITRKPLALASALRKIESVAVRHPVRGSSATAHMWIANPFKRDWFSNLFATHPAMSERIRRLQEMDPKEILKREKQGF